MGTNLEMLDQAFNLSVHCYNKTNTHTKQYTHSHIICTCAQSAKYKSLMRHFPSSNNHRKSSLSLDTILRNLKEFVKKYAALLWFHNKRVLRIGIKQPLEMPLMGLDSTNKIFTQLFVCDEYIAKTGHAQYERHSRTLAGV